MNSTMLDVIGPPIGPEAAPHRPATLTRLIHSAQGGDSAAAEALFDATYCDLHRIARARLRGCRHEPMLDTGTLVHESYFRFIASGQLHIEDRCHFFHWASAAMRSIVVDIARRRRATRRGGDAVHTSLDTEEADLCPARLGSVTAEEEILAVHQALDRLATADPRSARVVEMRYFSGMTEPEIALALDITERTVRRDWQRARLLLREVLASQADTAA